MFDPRQKGGTPGAGGGGPFGVRGPETVAAGGAAVESVRHVVGSKGRVEQQAVAEIDNGIILAGHEEDRRTIRPDVALDGKRIAQGLVPLPPNAQGAASRPFVGQRSRNGQWTMDNGQ